MRDHLSEAATAGLAMTLLMMAALVAPPEKATAWGTASHQTVGLIGAERLADHSPVEAKDLIHVHAVEVMTKVPGRCPRHRATALPSP